MRILAVATWYPTTRAPGVGVFIDKDVRALAERHDVHLVHLGPPSALEGEPATSQEGRLRITRVPFDVTRPDHYLRAGRVVRRAARDADVVHSMAFSALLPLVLVPPGRPWVHTEHWSGFGSPETVGGIWKRLSWLRRVAARPDVVTAVSEFLAGPIRRVRRGPTLVVPCIVTGAAPTPRRPASTAAVTLVSTGGLVPGKDPMTAVRTVGVLRERGVDASLTWLGEGPLRPELEAETARLGLTDHVRLPGHVDPAEVPERVAAADVFLLPTLRETFCVAAAEALGQGRPVVIGGSGGHTEFVDDSVGALVPTQSPEAYADAVLDVVQRLAGTSAEQIAERVRTRFSADAVRAGYEQAYHLATHGA